MNQSSKTSDPKSKAKKSTINEIIKSYVTNKINEYLGKYLNNIKKEDLQTSIGNHSAITLTNLQLKKDAFNNLRLPIEVDPSSVVREIRCELRMIPTQVHIHVKGVRAKVHPNSKFWSSDQWQEYKLNSLNEWEENQKHLFENLNMKSYKQRKLNMVANNTNIIIEDIVILFENPNVLGVPCAIRFRIEEFKIATTSPDFSSEKVSNNEEATYRKILIKDFSVAIKKKDGSDEDCDFSERMYLIRPFTTNITYIMRHKPADERPVHTLTCNVNNLVISINDIQRQIIEALSYNFNNQAMYKAYEENRPASNNIQGKEQIWWNFLIRSCKKDLDMNFAGLIRNKTNMDKYIDYYKSCQQIIHAPWLKDETPEKREFLKEIENEYSLEKILTFRTLALYQLRIEAMSYVKARGNVRGRTHLGDLWDYYLNDFESLLGDPYKTVAEEHEIELSLEEKEELNYLIKLDELNIVNSYLSGTSSSRNDKFIQVSFEIRQVRIFIQDSQNSDDKSFLQVNPNDCLCPRCKERRVKLERPSAGFFENNDDFRKKLEGGVISIMMVNSDGKSYDPRLVKEKTLLILETSVKGNFMIFRDMHLETTNERIVLSDIEIWDPFTLQDSQKQDYFKANFGFSSSNDLLNNILEGINDDIQLINSLRFFLHEYNLVPEFEFLIHYLGLTQKNMHLCICKKSFADEKQIKNAFLSTDSNLCLHMTQEKLDSLDKKSLKEIFNEIFNMFQKRVMPRFIRNCIRWIIGNNPRQNFSSKSSDLKIVVQWQGKSSPLQVQFKKKGNSSDFDKIFEEKKVKIKGELLEICISSETVHSLIRWIMKSGDSFTSQKSFISTLQYCSPKIEYIKTLINNLKKKENSFTISSMIRK